MMHLIRRLTTIVVCLSLLVVLPPAGVLLAGRSLRGYMEFPPLTRYVEHAGFSWLAFSLVGLLIAAVVTPFIIRLLSFRAHPARNGRGLPAPVGPNAEPAVSAARRPVLPWWGWAGVALTSAAWFLAWTRFPWFAGLQKSVFTPLWVGYVVIVNALTFRRSGRCMVTDRPRYVALLFFVSAAFWWFFEYLNRFVQNWVYIGITDLTPARYFLFATLPFSTVLPAVLGTRELLATYPSLTAPFLDWIRLRPSRPRTAAGIALALAAGGLAGIGVCPDFLYPLLWVSPLVIIVAVQILAGQRTIFEPLRVGDWRSMVLFALSALVCGFFWEMWNFRSEAKWVYSVAFVDRFHLFEMPLLGFAGYIPFGLECALAADLFLARRTRNTAARS